MNNVVPKVYNIDYEFIISNYLDPNLWTKSWNLFVYKDNVFTLSLHSIDCYDMTICFRIQFNKMDSWNNSTNIWYNIRNTRINILKNQINGAMWKLICSYDKELAQNSSKGRHLKDLCDMEHEHLYNIAESFLDDNNVTNEVMRDAYIDKFIAENSVVDDITCRFIEMSKYSHASDLIECFLNTTKDNDRLETVLTHQKTYTEHQADFWEEVNDAAAELYSDEWVIKKTAALEDI